MPSDQSEKKKTAKKVTKKTKSEAAAPAESALENQAAPETTAPPPAPAEESKTTAAPSTPAPTSTSKPQTMADLLAQAGYTLTVPKRGDTVKGTITKITSNSLAIDIGAKTEGIVSDKEFDIAREYIDALKVGQEVEAMVMSEENNQGQVLLSLKRAALDARWDYFYEAFKNDQILDAHGVDVNKGGLIVVVNGARGFVPSSQFSKQWVGNFMQLKGRDLQVKVIEVDREKNRLIFSERHVTEAEEIAQKEEALESVKAGEIYEGVVSGVMHFGLFVTVEVPVPEKDGSIGHVEGLVHISEISWEKVSHPRDYHKVGDRLKVRVLGIDDKTGKLNLSIKQLSDDPWKDIADRYQSGTTVEGTVSRIEPFGVFVNVEAGIDGLVHSSKLESHHQYERGDKVTVHVESVDPDQRRMSLSFVTAELPVEYR